MFDGSGLPIVFPINQVRVCVGAFIGFLDKRGQFRPAQHIGVVLRQRMQVSVLPPHSDDARAGQFFKIRHKPLGRPDGNTSRE